MIYLLQGWGLGISQQTGIWKLLQFIDQLVLKRYFLFLEAIASLVVTFSLSHSVTHSLTQLPFSQTSYNFNLSLPSSFILLLSVLSILIWSFLVQFILMQSFYINPFLCNPLISNSFPNQSFKILFFPVPLFEIKIFSI